HVERLIQAFAFLTGRVHHKLDDEFPELTDALLGVLYPHYLAPVPSCLIAEFVADPTRTPLAEGFTIPRQSTVAAAPGGGLGGKHRPAYPVPLWPVRGTDARVQGPPFHGLRLPAGIRPPDGTAAIALILLECQAGASFSTLPLQTLRFHLD